MEHNENQEQADTKDRLPGQDKKFFNLMSRVMHAKSTNGELLIMRNFLTRPFPYNLPQAGWCDDVVELNTFTYLYN